MTPFSDDDLKRLKLLVGRSNEQVNVFLPKQTFDALLARLEAAEEVLPFFISEHKITCTNHDCVVFEQVKIWRKAAGK
jgi:hypothetical protein